MLLQYNCYLLMKLVPLSMTIPEIFKRAVEEKKKTDEIKNIRVKSILEHCKTYAKIICVICKPKIIYD